MQKGWVWAVGRVALQSIEFGIAKQEVAEGEVFGGVVVAAEGELVDISLWEMWRSD